LIHLVGVAKSYPGVEGTPEVVLRPSTITLPADRRVAVLAGRKAGKSTLLKILGRNLAPDQGEVITAAQLSPVVNSGGLLHPQLSGMENLQFLARAFCVDADLLLLAAHAFAGPDLRLSGPMKTQDAPSRRLLETALAIVLPFDCYLFDDASQLPPALFGRCIEAADKRQAGIIFATNQPRLARQFADVTVVINDASLYPFTRADKAIQFFERHAR